MRATCSGQSRRCDRTCRRWSVACPSGWTDSKAVPNPWVALEARRDLRLVRHQIAETGRYYDDLRTIVIRKGVLLEEERRYLWHELVHADRRDQDGHNSPAVERIVERHAAENAMPWVSLVWAWSRATNLAEAADLLKVPEEWVAFRLRCLHPARKAQLRNPDGYRMADSAEHFN